MILESSAFVDGGLVPQRYTCDGGDVSPPLEWHAVPPTARSLALVVDDPDAPRGTWVHWVVMDMPASAHGLPQGASGALGWPGAVEGRNSWGNHRYGGPCPPSGTHRYFFKLFALDGPLGLGTDTTSNELSRAMQGHVVAEASLIGRYGRRQA